MIPEQSAYLPLIMATNTALGSMQRISKNRAMEDPGRRPSRQERSGSDFGK